jgi:hypothetical protein
MHPTAAQNSMAEWSFRSSRKYAEPFREIELDAVFTDPDGVSRTVPAFWAGDDVWRVRYASPKLGTHTFRTVCSDAGNAGLHGQEGRLDVRPYEGHNLLLRHGPLRTAAGGRHLEHADGTPFFWLGDTWWYGLLKDFEWPGEFQEAVADRVAKGFNLIHIVVGYLPAMPEHHPRNGNEGGEPWDREYRQVNPAFFDWADHRIDCLVQNGLAPCIFSMWGYWMLRLGIEGAKRHWRYLVARYGAYPVVWSLCGEVAYVYPDFVTEIPAAERDKVAEYLVRGWSEVCRYLAAVDPYGHPITAHTYSGLASSEVLEPGAPLTVNMTQTGHSFPSLDTMCRAIPRLRALEPPRPVINGECVYESIMGASWQEIQRLAIWACVLNGAAGHTYGAEGGGWQICHRDREPFDYTSGVWSQLDDWREIAALPGSGQMQHVRRLLERYEWWRFERHLDWVESGSGGDGAFRPHCAGIPGLVRVVYVPVQFYGNSRVTAITGLEEGVQYQASLYDPRTGRMTELGPVQSENGRWVPEGISTMYRLDYVIVLETAGARVGSVD